MKVQRRHNGVFSTGVGVEPSERPRPLEALMMAALILIGVIATNAII